MSDRSDQQSAGDDFPTSGGGHCCCSSRSGRRRRFARSHWWSRRSRSCCRSCWSVNSKVCRHPRPMPESPIHPRIELTREWMTFQRHMSRGPVSTCTRSAAIVHLRVLPRDGRNQPVAGGARRRFLTFSAVLISWHAVNDRLREYFASLLILEAGLSGAFCAFDLVLFYVFFEFTLLPLFFLVGVWGGPKRREAAMKFFLYTFAGSVITLTGLCCSWFILFGRNNLGVSVFDPGDRPDSLAERSPPPRCRLASSWRCRWALRSRSRFFRSIPGCRWHTSKRRRRAACFWPASCSSSGPTGSCGFASRFLPRPVLPSACR